jgi:YggT family protein
MLHQIISLLLEVAVGLVASTCLLRLYMQLQRINLSLRMGNPLAPFIFSLTNWLILPLRRVLPAIGRLDTACLVGAYAVVLAKVVLLWLWAGASAHASMLLVLAFVELLHLALSGLSWLVIGYALLSWFRGAADIGYFLSQLIEPLLHPLRRVVPMVGGIDLSPLALLLLIKVAEIVLGHAVTWLY